MKLDDLKAAWKQEIDRSFRAEELSMKGITGDVAEIHRSIRLRDFWMIFGLAGGALIALVFGWWAQEKVDALSRLSIVAFVVMTAVVSVALLRARRVTRSDDWTLRSRIEMEIERIEKQRTLMNRVGYWFLLPLLVANGLSSLGGYDVRTGNQVPSVTGWVMFATSCAWCGFTYWLVRRGVRKQLDPVLARLRRLHADLVGEGG